MSELSDELRIIARDRPRLDDRDCVAIARAADMIDRVDDIQAALIESQARQIATQDRLLTVIGAHNRQALRPLSATVTITGYLPSWGTVR